MMPVLKIKRLAAGLAALACVWGTYPVPHDAGAYIMPSDQVLGFVADHFRRFKTISILQSARLMNSQGDDPAMVFQERIWVEPPRFYRFQIVTETEETGISPEEIQASRLDIDSGYRYLFASGSPQDLSARLLAWGIDTSLVSFTRLEGKVAYAIGDHQDKNKPTLLIEKKHFLPVLLRYRKSGRSDIGPVTLRFHDYRKLGAGTYPFRIDCFLGEELIEQYLILEIKFNVPFPEQLFGDEETNPETGSNEPPDVAGQ